VKHRIRQETANGGSVLDANIQKDFAGQKIWAKLVKSKIELLQMWETHRTHIKDYAEHAAKALKTCFDTKRVNEEI